MKYKRRLPAVTVLNDQLYVMGGDVDDVGLDYVERYDPQTKTWETLAPLLSTRTAAAACAHNNHVYVIGGNEGKKNKREKHQGKEIALVDRYDPINNNWQRLACINYARDFLSVSVFENKIFAFGGNGKKAKPFKYIERYDGERDEWEMMPNSFAVTGACVSVILPKRVLEAFPIF